MYFLKSCFSVIAGFAVIFGALALTSWILPKVVGPFVIEDPDPSLLAFTLLLFCETLAIVLGCYVAARLSASRPMIHAFLAGGIVLILSLWTALQRFGLYPLWYLGGGLILTLPAAWLGGMVRVRQFPKQT
jgi:hypothetical protein